MATMKYWDEATHSYVDFPIIMSGNVISVNGKTGIVELNAADIHGLPAALNEKINEPATEGTSGQVLATDGAGNRVWVTPGAAAGTVTSVNGIGPDALGNVLIDSAHIKNAAGTKTIANELNEKIDKPIGGTTGQVLVNNGTAVAWADEAVESVNSKTGDVVLSAADIKNAAGTKTVETLLDERIEKPTTGTAGQVLSFNGTKAVWADEAVKKVNTKTGEVVLDAKDIKLSDGSKTVEDKFDDKVDLPANDATATVRQVIRKTATGTEWADDCSVMISKAYTSTASYAIGDIVNYNGNIYVCKAATTGAWVAANWKQTTTEDEKDNFLDQLCAALGIGYTKTWDTTNNRVDYGFHM